MFQSIPYCGLPPSPVGLWDRFNTDPVLLLGLLILASSHCLYVRKDDYVWKYAAAGWLLAATALVSPLCAVSVSLFSARIAQHMILVLAAAPLIALALPLRKPAASFPALSASAGIFFFTLWFWHMPLPYEATFKSSAIYWAMHLSLSGSAVWLWRGLLHHPPARTFAALAVGAFSSIQMGLLGAILAFATRPLFKWHLTTTYIWGLTPLQDQQLGGVFMWIPGVALFLCVAIRSVNGLWPSGAPRSA